MSGGLRRWARRDAQLIRELRDDLRHVVENGGTAAADNLTTWTDRLGMRPAITGGQITYRHDGRSCGTIAKVRRYQDRQATAQAQ